MTNDNASPKFLLVSIFPNSWDTTAQDPTKKFVIEFRASKWGPQTQDWTAPTRPAACVEPAEYKFGMVPI